MVSDGEPAEKKSNSPSRVDTLAENDGDAGSSEGDHHQPFLHYGTVESRIERRSVSGRIARVRSSSSEHGYEEAGYPSYVLTLRPILRPLHCGSTSCSCTRYNGYGVNNAICNCGEEDTDFDWTWDRDSKSTAAMLASNDREVKFHTEYSCGTAAVRGNQPMTASQYYWEVKMTSPVYGTDMMVGVGTYEMDLNKFRHVFGSLLGYDNESWGFSYYGNVHHKGRTREYSSKFGQGSVIGVHLDMWRGTVAFFKNRQPLGIAYKGLQGKILYPMVASTAARSGMRVIKSKSFSSSLQFLCCEKIRELVPSNLCVLEALNIPPGLKTFLKNNLDWLLCARIGPCSTGPGFAAAVEKDAVTCNFRRRRSTPDEEESSVSGSERPTKRQRVA